MPALPDPEVARRRTEVFRLRQRGMTFAQVAAEIQAQGLGSESYDAACAYNDIKRTLEKVVAEQALSVEEHRASELALADHLLTKVLDVMDSRHVFIQGGKVVVDEETGMPIKDDGPTLNAAALALKIGERRAKLTGSEAPTRIDSTQMVNVRVEGVDLEALK